MENHNDRDVIALYEQCLRIAEQLDLDIQHGNMLVLTSTKGDGLFWTFHTIREVMAFLQGINNSRKVESKLIKKAFDN